MTSRAFNALFVLCSPRSTSEIDAWRAASRHSISTLVNGHTEVSFLDIDRIPTTESNREVNYDDYVKRYAKLDNMPMEPMAFTWETIQAGWAPHFRDQFATSEFYNDWVRPHALCQPSGLIVRIGPPRPNFVMPRLSGICGLWFYRDYELPNHDDMRELAILQLLLPAFDASVHLLARSATRGGNLPEMLDQIDGALALYDETGRCVHENRALQRLVLDDAKAPRLRRECAQTSIGIAAILTNRLRKSRASTPEIDATREVRTGLAHYKIRGVLLCADIAGPHPLVAVMLTRDVRTLPSNATLREFFSLTHREITVANLLANGHSNGEIALRLGVTIHTARRHVEHIFTKLGAHTRGAAAAKLRSIGQSPSLG